MELDFLPDISRAPDYGLIDQPSYNVDTVKFGDNFTQRRPAGLNSVMREWTVTWSLITREEMERLRDFLNSRQGVYAFLWGVPGEPEALRVVCKEPPKTVNTSFGRHTLSATLTEDFGL
ncbi:phage tail protein [Halomonas sp. V046]|uniref:phage tail protein n=1 Tax=Halomonas sp. V046 TaxID=3459611 RepID=UPI004043EC1D